jgi:hypothetical protein
MAYITRTGNVTYNKAKFKPHDRQRVRVAKVTHNATATAITASNVVNMIPIPAESVILGVSVLVSDNQTNTDIKIGVTADDDTFSAATALDANGLPLPSTTGTLHGNPYYTNAATNIVITAVTNDINSAVITLVATYIELDAMAAHN